MPRVALSQSSAIVFDFDDVFFPADNGTHARIKELIIESVSKDLGPASVLASRDSRGHLIYFPQYVLSKFIEAGRNSDSPSFIEAMERCYFGSKIEDPDHYRVIGPAPELHKQLTRLKDGGIKFIISSSGPYLPHMQRVLSLLGIQEFFPRSDIYDIGRMCALYDDIGPDDFHNPTDDRLLRWLKPRRENYLAVTIMAGLQPGANLYLEDNDTNGSRGATDTVLPPASVQAIMSKFGKSIEEVNLLNIPDRWGWINLSGTPLRNNNTPPALETKTLVDALQLVSLF